MKTFYIQIRDAKGHLSYVSSFSANSDQMAFMTAPEPELAVLFEFTHASAIAAMLGAYGNDALVRHI